MQRKILILALFISLTTSSAFSMFNSSDSYMNFRVAALMGITERFTQAFIGSSGNELGEGEKGEVFNKLKENPALYKIFREIMEELTTDFTFSEEINPRNSNIIKNMKTMITGVENFSDLILNKELEETLGDLRQLFRIQLFNRILLQIRRGNTQIDFKEIESLNACIND